MDSDGLFDRDDEFEHERQQEALSTLIRTPLDPEAQEVIDAILQQRDTDTATEINLAKQVGMGDELILSYVCEKMRRVGIPVVRASFNEDGRVELDVVHPRGVG